MGNVATRQITPATTAAPRSATRPPNPSPVVGAGITPTTTTTQPPTPHVLPGPGTAGAGPGPPLPEVGAEQRDGAGGAAAGTGAVAAATPTPDASRESGEGHWVLEEDRRKVKLQDFYDVPDREMGRGHYGIVRMGERRSDGMRVAVKTIPKRRLVYIDMLKNEIGILRALDNANIIKLLDEFEDEQQVHLVFELCMGGELFEPIADQGFRFTERQASRLVRKMLGAVKYCHDLNIVHRDLKPENILLTDPGVECELKIIDFGLATKIKPDEALTRHVGTPYYIAPEVLAKSYGKPCDIWSVGVITFTLLCGFPPFWGDTEREIYGRVRRGYYAFEGPDWYSRSVWSKDLIQKLLTLNPARRCTVEDALEHMWIVYEGEVIDPRSRRIMGRLRRFALFPWLKRQAMVIVARSLTQSQLAYARDMFEAFERHEATSGGATTEQGASSPSSNQPQTSVQQQTDGAGAKITVEDFVVTLRERGVSASDVELRGIHAGLDINGDGGIDFHEMAAAAMSRLLYLSGPQIVDVFAQLDCDQDGRVTYADLRAITSHSTACAALSEADLSNSGFITLADFTAVVCGNEQNIL